MTMSAPPAADRDAVHAAALATAVAALEPFFDRDRTWSGAGLEHFAYRALRDMHPELGTQEAYVIVVAAARVYGESRARDDGRTGA